MSDSRGNSGSDRRPSRPSGLPRLDPTEPGSPGDPRREAAPRREVSVKTVAPQGPDASRPRPDRGRNEVRPNAVELAGARGGPLVEARDQQRQAGGFLEQVGGVVQQVLRFWSDSVYGPIRSALSRRLRGLGSGDRHRFQDRVIDSNTYDPEKARDWERFRKGKASSGYLKPDD